VPTKESYICNGGNYSIILDSGHLILQQKGWRFGLSQKISLRDVRSVIVERKSVMPFATMTVLSMIGAVALQYNVFWFVINLSPEHRFTVVAILAALLFAVPTVSRAFFVNVIISSARNGLWRVRFVPTRSGKRLAIRFRDLSGSQT
jgi:hypothetical protein